jgi:hypothetical protein
MRSIGYGEELYPQTPVPIDGPVPPHPKFAVANFDLSPQAGRGETIRIIRLFQVE